MSNLTSKAKNFASQKSGTEDVEHNEVFLDLETTGFGKDAEILQMCYFIEGRTKGVYNEYYAPENGFSFKAMGINRITPEMVEGKQTFGKGDSLAYDKLKQLNTEENYIVIHNAKYDLGELEKYGFTNKMQVIDTIQVAYHICNDAESHALSSLFFQYGLYRQMGAEEKRLNQEFSLSLKRLGAHNALYDVVMLRLLYSFLAKKAGGIKEMVRLTNTPCFLDKPFYFGKYKGKKPSEVAKTDIGYLEWLLDNFDDLDFNVRYTLEQLVREQKGKGKKRTDF